MIEFQCPTCSHPLSASEEMAGGVARCPGCGREVTIPGRPAAEIASGPTEGAVLTAEERQWGMLCHLSGLIATAAGGMSFLGPLICWMIKKDSSRWIDYHGKEALNFHLNILGYMLIAGILTFLICITFPLLIIIPIYSIVMSIVAAIQANDGKRYQYPGIYRLVV